MTNLTNNKHNTTNTRAFDKWMTEAQGTSVDPLGREVNWQAQVMETPRKGNGLALAIGAALVLAALAATVAPFVM